jgi:hypothetical protein
MYKSVKVYMIAKVYIYIRIYRYMSSYMCTLVGKYEYLCFETTKILKPTGKYILTNSTNAIGACTVTHQWCEVWW